ncbi:hypothetical protein GKC30_13355 [Pseudodesulfovibrio sp. F-1]|uniref:Alpha/beta hydrolase n=1 Tax=Pseudodesulfovibrio alkaliphilus TaxID=2661613 RepID=A0A7K1KRW8_9BACT|nr:alpha/beta hydrolase [Pseudodesulfovibrio alkaliphilus]MUM78621.1 hypothetical protein [Pseudodesulfovibrio alkaliphilus]
MTDDFLFVSGWAGYPELYPSLAGKGEFLLPFVGCSEGEIFHRLDVSPASTLIGWSTGAHMILKRWSRVTSRFERIILLAPFLAFTDHVPETAVRAMIRSMRRNPEQTVRRFHADCGYAGRGVYREGDAEGLIAGLEYLRTSRAMPAHPGGSTTILVRGERDRIVPFQATESLRGVMPDASCLTLACGHYISGQDLADVVV